MIHVYLFFSFLLLNLFFLPLANATDSIPIFDNHLVLESLGKTYERSDQIVPYYLYAGGSDLGGTTSVRRNDPDNLKWKTQGYYQRNRELGQVINIPEWDTIKVDAVVLRTGNSRSAVLSGAPGAPVHIQFFEVIGTPTINDNGTPLGTPSEHGFSTNHRTDDYLDGITYKSIALVQGGVFPDIEPTNQNGGQPGHLHFIRWDLQDEAEIVLEGGKRYAFMVGFSENGPQFGFSMGNTNLAAEPTAPRLRKDSNGLEWWSMRREGDGTLPPTQIPGDMPPAEASVRESLQGESLFNDNHECELSPTTDGFPDVDTYRTMEFYIERKMETTNTVATKGEVATLHIYPNPSDGEVTIQWEQKGKSTSGQINIFNLNGQLLQQQTISLPSGRHTLPLHLVDRGFLQVQVVTDEGVATQWVVVQ
jgi:hypothetical protein